MPLGARLPVATEPAVRTTFDPIVTPGPTKAEAQTQLPCSTRMGLVMRSNVGEV
jgi:hypothetical protein